MGVASGQLRVGCGIAGLASLASGSVDLVFADLPSGRTRAAFDERLNESALCTAAWQSLKPTGILILMASDLRFAAGLTELPHYRYEIIWRKARPTGFYNVRRMPLRAHEYLLVYYRTPGTYSPQMTQGHGPIHAATRKAATGHGANYGAGRQDIVSRAGATDRYPVSVLTTQTVGTTCKSRVHPQQKHPELLDWSVRTYSNPGDLVVDPCAGSGSMGESALRLGRRFIGFDLQRFSQEARRPP